MGRPLLKPYCKSVLRVQVPLVVTLAEKKMRIDQILKLVPGVMLQFDKPCNAPMMVEVVGQPIAQGDVVKIGDKFGVRITEILHPAERFIAITGREPTAEESSATRPVATEAGAGSGPK